MKKYRVFVYGTLKRGEALNDCMEGEFICTSSTLQPEYTMFDLGSYPAVIPRGNRRIWGEVYEVTPKQLENIDLIECVPDLYVRSRIKLTNGDLAFIYFLAPDVAAKVTEYTEIVMGDWTVYKNSKSFQNAWS